MSIERYCMSTGERIREGVPRGKHTCEKCGSDQVIHTTSKAWDTPSQEWRLIYSDHICNECKHHSDKVLFEELKESA